MEMRLNRASFWLKEMDKALDGYLQIREDLQMLSEYYGSQTWKEDFEADEAGSLPARLKRGVLSEDGIDEVLLKDQEIIQRLRKMTDDPNPV